MFIFSRMVLAIRAKPTPNLADASEPPLLQVKHLNTYFAQFGGAFIKRLIRTQKAVDDISLQIHRGEILGVAGVSGNGQRELVEALVGQRPRLSGQVSVMGVPYAATRSENHHLKVRSLPEEPLHNACVGTLSVAENMALRDFDQAPLVRAGVLRFGTWRQRARAWIAEYGIKTQGETAPIASLSGGNVQRAVLARELAGEINVLIAANPEPELWDAFQSAAPSIAEAYEARDFARAMREIMALADRANAWIAEKAPWALNKVEGKQAEVQEICALGVNLFRQLVILLKPTIIHNDRSWQEDLTQTRERIRAMTAPPPEPQR